jgi:hypothetical protein
LTTKSKRKLRRYLCLPGSFLQAQRGRWLTETSARPRIPANFINREQVDSLDWELSCSIPSTWVIYKTRRCGWSTPRSRRGLETTAPGGTPASTFSLVERTEKDRETKAKLGFGGDLGAFYRCDEVGGLHRKRPLSGGGSGVWRCSTELPPSRG